jgi:uncharacterized membrane protein
VQKFKDDFAAAGAGQFGSGWAWLVKDKDGSLKVTKTENGVNPLCFGQTALLGCDVWEHSYYIDFRNKRPAYLTNFLEKLVNWEAVAEVAVLAIPAAIWLVLLHGGLAVDGSHSSGQFGADLATSALLALSGVLTAGPLILFSYASRRVSMAALGLMQYINPTLQFLCAVAIFREPFTAWHLVAFGLIWAALVLYSVGALRSRAAGRG